MILADKIIEERKRNGWSQEDLAEKLNVSRQSVSKWEGAQSVPDLNRILQMSELFGVTTDYLLKDEIENKGDQTEAKETVELKEDVRSVSMEEASEFLKIQEENAPIIAFGVSLCVSSAILLLVLSGFADSGLFGISENLAGGLGISVLLVMVAIAVFLFIKCGAKSKKYEYFDIEKIETAYGVDGMVSERKANFSEKYSLTNSIGVVLCIVSCIPLLVSSFLTDKGYIITAMVGVLLLIVAIAVNLFVRVGIINSSFDKLLQQGDYTIKKKKAAPVMNGISGIYWMVAVAIYLGWSFTTNQWHITWIVWPIAGVLFGAVTAIVKMIIKSED